MKAERSEQPQETGNGESKKGRVISSGLKIRPRAAGLVADINTSEPTQPVPVVDRKTAARALQAVGDTGEDGSEQQRRTSVRAARSFVAGGVSVAHGAGEQDASTTGQGRSQDDAAAVEKVQILFEPVIVHLQVDVLEQGEREERHRLLTHVATGLEQMRTRLQLAESPVAVIEESLEDTGTYAGGYSRGFGVAAVQVPEADSAPVEGRLDTDEERDKGVPATEKEREIVEPSPIASAIKARGDEGRRKDRGSRSGLEELRSRQVRQSRRGTGDGMQGPRTEGGMQVASYFDNALEAEPTAEQPGVHNAYDIAARFGVGETTVLREATKRGIKLSWDRGIRREDTPEEARVRAALHEESIRKTEAEAAGDPYKLPSLKSLGRTYPVGRRIISRIAEEEGLISDRKVWTGDQGPSEAEKMRDEFEWYKFIQELGYDIPIVAEVARSHNVHYRVASKAAEAVGFSPNQASRERQKKQRNAERAAQKLPKTAESALGPDAQPIEVVNARVTDLLSMHANPVNVQIIEHLAHRARAIANGDPDPGPTNYEIARMAGLRTTDVGRVRLYARRLGIRD